MFLVIFGLIKSIWYLIDAARFYDIIPINFKLLIAHAEIKLIISLY